MTVIGLHIYWYEPSDLAGKSLILSNKFYTQKHWAEYGKNPQIILRYSLKSKNSQDVIKCYNIVNTVFQKFPDFSLTWKK